jgi:hypothetical protein
VYGPLVSRRRDVRRYGRGPYALSLRREPERWEKGFPFDVPAVTHVERLRLGDAPVTLLAGDNGSGKSTLVEAIAEAMGFAAQGADPARVPGGADLRARRRRHRPVRVRRPRGRPAHTRFPRRSRAVHSGYARRRGP